MLLSHQASGRSDRPRPAGDSGELTVVGAGPAGLAVAILAAKAGRKVVVHERHRDVGSRFHGDFQGLENWSSEIDALDELRSLGIEPSFDAIPRREQVAFGPDGRRHTFRSARPFYYLLRRGDGPGTLDRSLKEQALAAGVEIRFGDVVRHPPAGGVVAWGPRRADILAVGYLFETDLEDGSFAILDDRLAPGGYGYLLVHGGQATLATCLFSDFHNEARYLERTVEILAEKLGFAMRRPRRFGGVGNFHLLHPSPSGHIYWTGEAAGIQDALWGFGIRYALRSAQLAAAFDLDGDPESYHRAWEERIGGYLRTSLLNRYGCNLAGKWGYLWILRQLSRSRDPRRYLQRLYAPALWKRALLPLVYRSLQRPKEKVRQDCCCRWCADLVTEAPVEAAVEA
ncbi:MAG TPA: NAD(P)/FAD-dependent oxidoreductase [Thermoanaerobaculia bacterium]|nr:NAD(P)/FAD-dependent oxidoreductase [Thermoanaerobaculia bacterium]